MISVQLSTPGYVYLVSAQFKMYILTRFCVAVCSAISELMVAPVQERIDDWKKTVVSLDREHSRGQFVS